MIRVQWTEENVEVLLRRASQYVSNITTMDPHGMCRGYFQINKVRVIAEQRVLDMYDIRGGKCFYGKLEKRRLPLLNVYQLHTAKDRDLPSSALSRF